MPWSSSRLLWVGHRSSGFAVRSVGGRRQGCLSCGHHIPWRQAKTDGHQQCGYSVVKQQIPKFMGNGEITRAQSGDVTGSSRGPTTFMVMCSSKVMVTYLWEYAYVTKDDLSSQLATLFSVSC